MTVRIRAVRESDAAGIAEVCNALSASLYGDAEVSEPEIRRWIAMPDLETRVAELGGRVVGYADFSRQTGTDRYDVDVRVHPDAHGTGVAGALIAEAERRMPPGTRARGFPAEPDADLRSAFEERGYCPIRHSFHMRVDLDREILRPDWPEGISVRTFDPERDERRVFEAHMDAFSDHWEFHRVPIEEWRRWTVERNDFDPELFKLAEEGAELVGVSLNAWHVSGEPTFGWISVLGVRKPWRRRGLATALLLDSFADFRVRDATRVGLGVDGENTTGAVALYERVGMQIARRYDTYELVL